MSITHYTQEDFNLIPLLNVVAEPVAGAVTPGAGNVGRVYRNTVSGRLEFVLNATTVVSLPYSGSIVDADVNASAAIALSKLAVNPLARANHTGTQLAATISDLISTVTALTLNQFAAPTGAVALGSQKITGLADGVANTDATTLQQVTALLSSAVSGHDWKDGCVVAASSNVTITAPGASVDGVAMAAGNRVLLTAQTAATDNGIYVWNGSAVAMTRATDANTSAQVTSGMTTNIEQGTKAATISILTTPDPITLGTTALTFTFLAAGTAYTGGTGITVAGNVISLTSPVTVALGGTGATTAAGARTNLGVAQKGYAANLGAITAGGTVAVTHSLGTLDVVAQVFRNSDGATVAIAMVRTDINTVTVGADVAVSSGVLRLVVEPII